RAGAEANPPARGRVAGRLERGALLVAGQDVARAAVVVGHRQRVVERQAGAARDAEDHLGADELQKLGDHLAAAARLAAALATAPGGEEARGVRVEPQQLPGCDCHEKTPARVSGARVTRGTTLVPATRSGEHSLRDAITPPLLVTGSEPGPAYRA